MNVQCPKCKRVYKLKDPKKYSGKVKFTCPNTACGHLIVTDLSEMKRQVSTGLHTIVTGDVYTKMTRAYLSEIDANDRVKKTFFLIIGKNNLGRKPSGEGNDIVMIDDPMISRQHCVIEVILEDNIKRYVIYDDNSTNGVEVNGRKLSKYDKIVLKNNDHIKLGMTLLKFVID